MNDFRIGNIDDFGHRDKDLESGPRNPPNFSGSIPPGLHRPQLIVTWVRKGTTWQFNSRFSTRESLVRVSRLDRNKDYFVLSPFKNKCLHVLGDEYSGDNALCGSNHFWMVNDAKGNIPIAGVSLRRKNDAVDAGISTYGKCGMFKFSISDIRVLD